MVSMKTMHHVLFLLVALESMRPYTTALVSTIESRTSGDGADNFDVVSCNKNCTSGQNECPEGCFCGLLGQNKKGHCYKIIGNLSGEPPVVRR
uniref:Evasin n=2 Tax=Rhipicephalus sanguineus TaxID=34632 RepID=C9W1K0_RHISA